MLVATLSRGQYHDVLIDEVTATDAHRQIRTSQPAQVAQYMLGSRNNPGPGDPAMMLVVPTEQFLNHYAVTNELLDPQDYDQFFRVVVPSAEIGGLRVDGAPVTATFTPIGASGFSAAEIEVPAGAHEIRHLDANRSVRSLRLRHRVLPNPMPCPAVSEPRLSQADARPALSAPGDEIDNDCDGLYDEEIANGIDDDGDGFDR